MSRTWWLPSSCGNHTNGMPRRSAYLICLPYFGAAGATSAGMPRAAQGRGDRSRRRAVLLVGSATSTQVGVLRDAVSSPRDEQRPERAGHAERDADARGTSSCRRWRARRSARRSRSSRGARSPAPGLVDGARVVVEPARDPQVGHHGEPSAAQRRGAVERRGPARRGPRRAAGAARRARAPGRRTRRRSPMISASARQASGLLGGRAPVLDERLCARRSAPILSSLSTARMHRRRRRRCPSPR